MNIHSSERSFEILSERLQKRTGQTLLPDRHWRIQTSLQPIMREHGIPDLDALISVINSVDNSDLETHCLEAILNNESCFFRDQPHFALLTGQLLDAIKQKKEKDKKIRIWSSACSFGQEAVSLAISILENHQKWSDWDIEIVASDVSGHAISRAKKAIYSQFEVQRGLPIGLLIKYFTKQDQDWQAHSKILEMIQYRQYNLVDDSRYIGKFDLILCRNMVMYLNQDNKVKAFENIEKALNPDGYLMLGSAETITGYSKNLVHCQDFRGFYKFQQP